MEQSIIVSNAMLEVAQDYVLRLMYTGNTTLMYSMSAVLITEDNSGACAVALLGENRREIIAVTEPVRLVFLSHTLHSYYALI